MSIDPKLFRTILGRFATGVTVVTVQTPSRRRGMTANAFSSVSLDPPLVLVCVDRRATSLELLRQARKFAINFLAESQRSLSEWFAGKSKDAADPFAEVPHEAGENGAPLFKDTLGSLECDFHKECPGGDHRIVLGRVTRVHVEEEAPPPLLFYASAYRKMDRDGVFDA